VERPEARLPADPPKDSDPPGPDDRVAGLVKAEFAFVWRCLRRLGLRTGEADDGAQQVFLVAARRIDDIEPGRERAFLFSTSMHVAAKARRTEQRRREVTDDELEDRADAAADRDSVPNVEELVDRRRARELLDGILDEMPFDLRVVFVLYEVEELTMAEIATALELPPGTVASRLRRARAEFSERVARIEARTKFPPVGDHEARRGGQP
jgi:RNA polymerase sigma-70 factor (ECF subfamily)